MDFNRILPSLFVGSCPKNSEDVDQLTREAGITAVVNLQTESDFAYWGIDWPRLQAHYNQAGVEVRRVPVQDFEPETLRAHLPACVEAVDQLMKRGHTVYLHCSAGVNRSPSTAIAYLHWIEGRTLDDAVDHVMHCRSCDPYVESIRRASEDRRQ